MRGYPCRRRPDGQDTTRLSAARQRSKRDQMNAVRGSNALRIFRP